MNKRHQLCPHALRPQSIGDRREVLRRRDPEVDVVRLQVFDQHRDLNSHGRGERSVGEARVGRQGWEGVEMDGGRGVGESAAAVVYKFS